MPKYVPTLSTSKQDRNKKRKGKIYQSRKSLHLLFKLFLAASFWQETNTAHTVSPSKLTLMSDHLSYCSQLLFYVCYRTYRTQKKKYKKKKKIRVENYMSAGNGSNITLLLPETVHDLVRTTWWWCHQGISVSFSSWGRTLSQNFSGPNNV